MQPRSHAVCRRHPSASLLIVLALLVASAGCSGGSNAARSGDTRGNTPSVTEGRSVMQPGADQATRPVSPGPLTATELTQVYQTIVERYVEEVDHTVLVEGAVAAVRETGLKSAALPIDFAAVDLVPVPAGDPAQDWVMFARAYDALVGKHTAWAQEARPDWAVLRKMLGALADDHSVFSPPEDVQRSTETGFSGVGVIVRRQGQGVDESPYVAEVLGESPAAAAGVLAADTITAVDGVPTTGRSMTDVASGIRGAEGTSVVLSIVRGGQPPVEIRITRAPVNAPLVEASVRANVLGVMRIRNFSQDVPPQVQRYLMEGRNRGAQAWILDLRGNPGGSLRAMAQVAINFVGPQPVGVAVDRTGQRRTIGEQGRPAVPRFPFVVLVDKETASGAELLAAAVKDYQLAPVVGTRTAGRVRLAETQALSDGSSYQVSIGVLMSPMGGMIDRQGLQPDVEAERTLADLQRGDDPVFARAVEVLAGRPAQITR